MHPADALDADAQDAIREAQDMWDAAYYYVAEHYSDHTADQRCAMADTIVTAAATALANKRRRE
jgi:hypothetical protein